MNENPDLNKDFIFVHPAYNFRSTEINAVLGLSQIEKLDVHNERRKDNFRYFMERLDPQLFVTDLEIEGQCNYAFILILNPNHLSKADSFMLRDKIEVLLDAHRIEFRRGLSGGGSQIKQPFIKKNFNLNEDEYENVEHIHHFSWYVGNYPSLKREQIDYLLKVLNSISSFNALSIN